MNGALFATWVSRIPALQAGRGLSHGALGLALLAIALGAVIAMPLAGWCSSRFGSRRVTQLAAAMLCVSLPILVLAPNGALFALANAVLISSVAVAIRRMSVTESTETRMRD